MSRERFDRFLSGDPGPPPFIPFALSVSERLSGQSALEMRADATVWARTAADAARYLGASAAVIWGGAEGEGDLNEAVNVLAGSERASLGVVAALDGPLTVCGGSDDVAALKETFSERITALCQQRPDLIVLRESFGVAGVEIGAPHQKLFGALRNVANYYSVKLAVFLHGYDSSNVPDLKKLRPGAVFLGADHAGAAPSLDAVRLASSMAAAVGAPLDFSEGEEKCAARLAEYGEALQSAAYCLTSLGDLPKGLDFSVLRAVASQITR